MNRLYRRRSRSGNVLVLTAVMMVAMFGLLAFAVDLGYLHVARSQLQNSADASALAAAWDLIDAGALRGDADPWPRIASAQATARQYAGLNRVAGSAPLLANQDIRIGYLANPSDPNAQIVTDPAYASRFNAVRVLTRRTADQNGEIPLFFARVIGRARSGLQAEATAAFVNNFRGFRAPDPDVNLEFLPLALDKPTFDSLFEGGGTDVWEWNEEEQRLVPGSDGIREANLFPQGTGSPGNRGTVDIGSNNNSTADLARQILHGVSAADLAHHGGSLELDDNDELLLNGDTGISAGIKDELATIKGLPRIVPLFTSVSGNGNNAWYTIVGFAGIRIMDVKLTGQMSSKRVIIQPARIDSLGGIPATGESQQSQFIYSPVWLVR
jgi:Flp pilus assembly protein TadG